MKYTATQNIRETIGVHLRSGLLVLLVGVTLAMAPSVARANCKFDFHNSGGTYVVSIPPSLLNDPDLQVGSVLYTTAPTGIDHQVDFHCNGGGNGWGLVNDVGGPPATLPHTFPIGGTGVGYRVVQNGGYIDPYPYFDLGSGKWRENDPVTIELVKIGNIQDGSRINGGLFASFQAGEGNNPLVDAVIQFGNSLTFTAPACSVSNTVVRVTLPTVTRGAFNGVNSTTGTTPFQIGLTCSHGAVVRITLDTASPVAGKTGVIAPSGGNTSGVGVQVLDSSGTNPVSFGVPVMIGSTPDGALLVNYYARYFQTGSTVGAGTLSATATFTISYQ